MEELGIPNPEAVKDVLSSAGALVDKLDGKLPGVRLWIEDRAQVSHAKRMMDAVGTLREYGESIGLDSDIAMAIAGDALRNMGANERVAECVRRAIPRVEERGEPSAVADDWIGSWRSGAENAHDESVQRTWGAILAGEINDPGTFSKRTLSILKDMGKSDADAFVRLCSRCIGGKLGGVEHQPIPMLIGPGEPFAMDGDDIVVLNALGLIDFSASDFVLQRMSSTDAKNGIRVHAGGSLMAVRGDGALEIPAYPLTKYGYELAKLCDLGTAPGFADVLASRWRTAGFTVVMTNLA